MNSREIERCLQLLVRPQHGVVALGQLLSGGVTRGLIRGLRNRGRLEPLLPRVFRVDAAPMTKRMRCMVTVLWAGPGAVVSGCTATELAFSTPQRARSRWTGAGGTRVEDRRPGIAAGTTRWCSGAGRPALHLGGCGARTRLLPRGRWSGARDRRRRVVPTKPRYRSVA